MIVVKLQGGLGNQMFQYALGRSLSLTKGDDLKLDITSYDRDSLRSFELDKFNIKASIANDREIRHLTRFKMRTGMLNKLYNKLFADSTIYKKENSYSFDSSVLNYKKDVYFEGFWQSPLYFEAHSIDIRKDFSLKYPLPDSVLRKKQKIESVGVNSVAIHIRRTDYVTNPKTAAFHGALLETYYASAIRLIKQHKPNARFFVFSDDLTWINEKFKDDPHVEIISEKDIKDYEELLLMSSCSNFIIANSSYSWWAAWLSKSKDKIVIAPKKWTNTFLETTDLIPKSWLQI